MKHAICIAALSLSSLTLLWGNPTDIDGIWTRGEVVSVFHQGQFAILKGEQIKTRGRYELGDGRLILRPQGQPPTTSVVREETEDGRRVLVLDDLKGVVRLVYHGPYQPKAQSDEPDQSAPGESTEEEPGVPLADDSSLPASLPPVAGRWRVHFVYDRLIPGAPNESRETWDIHREQDQLRIVRLGQMMIPDESLWRREPVRVGQVVWNGRTLRFAGDSSSFALRVEADTMAGRFEPPPGDTLGPGRVTFARIRSFEEPMDASPLGEQEAERFRELQGLWEIVHNYDQVDSRGERSGREWWEIKITDNRQLRVHRVLGTLLPESMWERRPLPLTRASYQDGVLELASDEAATLTTYRLRIDEGRGEGSYQAVDESMWPHAAKIVSRAHLVMTHVPDFAVYVSSAPDAGFAGTLRRHAALYERWMRGDEEAGQQHQREVTKWKRGMAFITNQTVAEVQRIDQSNLRRRAFLSRMYGDQADESILAADGFDNEAEGYIKEGNIEKAIQCRIKAEKLRQYADDLRVHAAEVAPK